MYIKNILAGILGIVIFPTITLTDPLFFGFQFLSMGIITSILMILFYLIGVYVMEKNRSAILLITTYIVLISFTTPFGFINILSNNIRNYLVLIGLASLTISWIIMFYELIASKTFRGF